MHIYIRQPVRGRERSRGLVNYSRGNRALFKRAESQGPGTREIKVETEIEQEEASFEKRGVKALKRNIRVLPGYVCVCVARVIYRAGELDLCEGGLFCIRLWVSRLLGGNLGSRGG